jgi:hypothetical protein
MFGRFRAKRRGWAVVNGAPVTHTDARRGGIPVTPVASLLKIDGANPQSLGILNVPENPAKIPNFVKQENAPIRISAMKQENAPILIVSARVYHDGPHDNPGRLVIVETRLSDDPDDRTAYRFKSSEAAANFIRDVLCQEIPETTSFVRP